LSLANIDISKLRAKAEAQRDALLEEVKPVLTFLDTAVEMGMALPGTDIVATNLRAAIEGAKS
jgi:hypothetical protein